MPMQQPSSLPQSQRPHDGGRKSGAQRLVSASCVLSSCVSHTGCLALCRRPRISAGGLHPLDEGRPQAFLRRTVRRLCLDKLKSARRTRESSIGPWLPDSVVEEDEVEDATLPLMLVLKRLSKQGGGAKLTQHGLTVVTRFRAIEQAASKVAKEHLAALQAEMKLPSVRNTNESFDG